MENSVTFHVFLLKPSQKGRGLLNHSLSKIGHTYHVRMWEGWVKKSVQQKHRAVTGSPALYLSPLHSWSPTSCAGGTSDQARPYLDSQKPDPTHPTGASSIVLDSIYIFVIVIHVFPLNNSWKF